MSAERSSAASTAWVRSGGRRQRHLQFDFLGPAGLRAGTKFRRLRLAIATLRNPWAALVMIGLFAGLYALAMIGGLVTVLSASSPVGASFGVALVAVSVGISSHLVGVASRPGTN